MDTGKWCNIRETKTGCIKSCCGMCFYTAASQFLPDNRLQIHSHSRSLSQCGGSGIIHIGSMMINYNWFTESFSGFISNWPDIRISVLAFSFVRRVLVISSCFPTTVGLQSLSAGKRAFSLVSLQEASWTGVHCICNASSAFWYPLGVVAGCYSSQYDKNPLLFHNEQRSKSQIYSAGKSVIFINGFIYPFEGLSSWGLFYNFPGLLRFWLLFPFRARRPW